MSQVENYYFPVGNDVIKTETGSAITANDAVNFPLLEMKLYGKSTQNGTPTPETPVDIVSVGDDKGVKVQSCGKNLLDLSSVQSMTKNGITFTVNADGTVLANGTASAYSVLPLLDFNMKGEYIITGWPSGGGHATTGALSAVITHVDGSTSYATNKGNYKTFTVDDSVVNVQIRLEMHKGAVTNNTLFYPMLRFATDNAGYESYKGNTATLSTALPLCSVGKVCDELIYNAGDIAKVIKRTAKIDSYAGEEINTDYISTTGGLDEGSAVIYALATPEEIELTAEEMAQLISLYSYSGVTNVFNDEGAEMAVKYCTSAEVEEYILPLINGGESNE